MSILGKNQSFMELGGQFKATPHYFAGAQLTKLCVAGYGSWKTGVSARPPPERPFFAQKKAKNANFGAKTVFLSLGGRFMPPPPYFAGSRKKKCFMVRDPEIGCFKVPPPQMAIFCPKIAHLWQLWAENIVFWIRVVSSSPPQPSLQDPDSREHVLQGIGVRNWVIQGPLP